MTNFLPNTLAACAALVIVGFSMNAVVTVPPVQAATPTQAATIAMPELA